MSSKIDSQVGELRAEHETFRRESQEEHAALAEREEDHWTTLDAAIDHNKFAASQEMHELRRELALKVEEEFVKENCKSVEARILK